MPAAHLLRALAAVLASAPHAGSCGLFSRRRLSPALVALCAPATLGLREGEWRANTSAPASLASAIARTNAVARSSSVAPRYLSAF